MPRAGLTTTLVVEAAAELVDRRGIDALTLTGLAGHFGVRTPSLYNHVDGMEDLTRRVTVAAIGGLADACRDAAIARSGPDALVAIARAYRRWAREHPGTYGLIQVAHPGDAEWDRATRALLAPVLAVLSGMGIEGADAIHATRSFRSALHGFVLLETGSGFGIDLPIEESFGRLVDVVVAGIAASAPVG